MKAVFKELKANAQSEIMRNEKFTIPQQVIPKSKYKPMRKEASPLRKSRSSFSQLRRPRPSQTERQRPRQPPNLL